MALGNAVCTVGGWTRPNDGGILKRSMRATHLKRTSRRATRSAGVSSPRARATRATVDRTGVAPSIRRSSSGSARDEPRVPDRLLACTTEILSEQGVAFVSLRAVARRAGVSHGAPAYHFRSKAGLLAAYAAAGFHELANRVAAALERSSLDPRARLSTIGKAYVRFAIRNPQQFEIMFRREMLGTASKALEEASSRCWTLPRAGVVRDKAVAEGLIPVDETDRAIAASWAIAHGLAHLVLVERLPARLRARDPLLLAERTLDLFVEAILRGGARWSG